jgi:hypothetical protein
MGIYRFKGHRLKICGKIQGSIYIKGGLITYEWHESAN